MPWPRPKPRPTPTRRAGSNTRQPSRSHFFWTYVLATVTLASWPCSFGCRCIHKYTNARTHALTHTTAANPPALANPHSPRCVAHRSTGTLWRRASASSCSYAWPIWERTSAWCDSRSVLDVVWCGVECVIECNEDKQGKDTKTK